MTIYHSFTHWAITRCCKQEVDGWWLYLQKKKSTGEEQQKSREVKMAISLYGLMMRGRLRRCD